MQFQADILNTSVVRPEVTETTALGAAYLCGLAVGFWKDITEIEAYWKKEKVFSPQLADDKRKLHQVNWKKAIRAAQAWTEV
jgi:glycerol kinase